MVAWLPAPRGCPRTHMIRFGAWLARWGERLHHAGYLLQHPAYGVVRRQRGDRGLFRLLNRPWLPRNEIRTVLDVGANEGSFVVTARCLWPRARVAAFEPNPDVCDRLRARFHGDPMIEAFPVACGKESGTQRLHVARFSPASSLLAPAAIQLEEFPETATEKSVAVPVQRLDRLLEERAGLPPEYLLKIDVQGGELDVLRGAAGILPRVAVLVLEANLRRFYEGQPDWDELLGYVRELGFVWVDLTEPIRSRLNGEVLYFDAAFCRSPPP